MAQISKPDDDITDGGWLRSDNGSAVNLYQLVSDGTTTFIYDSSFGSPSPCTLALENLTDPSSASDHTISVSGRYQSSSSNIIFELFEGSNFRGGATGTLTNSFANYSYTLDTDEANDISDYTNLRIKLSASQGFSEVEITHAQFSVPDAGGGGDDGGADPYTTKLGNAEFTFRGLTDIGG